MISIECHRSGERCPGKREFGNRIEINRVRSGEIDVAIPFKARIFETFLFSPLSAHGVKPYFHRMYVAKEGR